MVEFYEAGKLKMFGVVGVTEVVLTPGCRTMTLKKDWIVLDARHQVMIDI